ncbi:hypothetical protein KDA_20830 [Dictyobacter alpinus]|uniref:DinB-like domain-containing protein n=1 Tax=Dictyobacter alpinus TaxID=2014873 RepID=A0A402B5J0_9CHLR|nr:DinB family protein [Dictyobacter alpinus]GCE26599.1 hypothetical protein KDA_20830 [Dictyobacter alpinus]
MAGIESPFVKVRRKLVMARIEFMGHLAAFKHEDFARPLTTAGESPLLIAHHLSTIEGIALKQLQDIQTQDNPQLDTLIQLLPVNVKTVEPPLTLDGVLEEMAVCRKELFAYLAQVSPEVWERPFIFSSWGPRKFYQLVNMLPLHDRQHSRQLITMLSTLP